MLVSLARTKRRPNVSTKAKEIGREREKERERKIQINRERERESDRDSDRKKEKERKRVIDRKTKWSTRKLSVSGLIKRLEKEEEEKKKKN